MTSRDPEDEPLEGLANRLATRGNWRPGGLGEVTLLTPSDKAGTRQAWRNQDITPLLGPWGGASSDLDPNSVL